MTDSTAPALSGRERLEAARAEAAALAERKAATEATPAPASVTLPQVGDTVVVLVATSVDTGEDYPWTNVMARGAKFRITAGALARARDRFGTPCSIALAADPAAQLKAWGEQRFLIGALPEDFQPWSRPGSAEWGAARSAAIESAYLLRGDERASALAEVNRVFGGPPSHENVTRYRGDSGDWPDAR